MRSRSESRICSLSVLVLLVELAEAGSDWACSSAMRRSWSSMASRRSRLLGRLDLDHPLGVDLVDLAEPLVALGLAVGDGLAVVVFRPFQVLVAARLNRRRASWSWASTRPRQ